MASVCETMLVDYIDSDDDIPTDEIDQVIFVICDKYDMAPWVLFGYYEYMLGFVSSYDAICTVEENYTEIWESVHAEAV